MMALLPDAVAGPDAKQGFMNKSVYKKEYLSTVV